MSHELPKTVEGATHMDDIIQIYIRVGKKVCVHIRAGMWWQRQCVAASPREPSSQNTNWTEWRLNYQIMSPAPRESAWLANIDTETQRETHIQLLVMSQSSKYDLLKSSSMQMICRNTRDKKPYSVEILGWQALGGERMETFLFN